MKNTILLAAVILFSVLRCSAQSADLDKTYTKVMIEAHYPGGDTAWMHFLNHNLRYPDDAVNNEIKGTVIVQFIVNTDSTISDIQAISGPTKGGLREESVRVISLSGKWIPAMQNGHAVRSYKKEPLVFKLDVSK
jgi:periplasmic protein TonB